MGLKVVVASQEIQAFLNKLKEGTKDAPLPEINLLINGKSQRLQPHMATERKLLFSTPNPENPSQFLLFTLVRQPNSSWRLDEPSLSRLPPLHSSAHSLAVFEAVQEMFRQQ